MDRCQCCRDVTKCPVCKSSASKFDHVGVRASTKAQPSAESGLWHFARPCGHKANLPISPSQRKVVYNGGPLWKTGYSWQNVYWGPFFATAAASPWVTRLEKATRDIESDKSYSGGLAEYDVGIGHVITSATIRTPPSQAFSDNQLRQALTDWINQGLVSRLGTRGAYNIFLPPGVIVSLSPLEKSCGAFCDYHNTVNASNGPFYTVEPYPCSKGCNRCTNDLFDTLTQGLSEEMVELKTDMDPGTGWVIGNEELCDFCDRSFVCNQITGGEFVNSWYDRGKGACWKSANPTPNTMLVEDETGLSRIRLGSSNIGRDLQSK